MKSSFFLNKETIKKVEIYFGIFTLIMVIKSAIEAFIDLQNQKPEMFNGNILLFSGAIFGSILAGIFENIYLVIIFAALKWATHSSNKKRLDETDFEKNKQNYRDIIKNYSISELNYIDSFKLEKKQSYTAKLLELEKKKIIKIEDGNILIIGNPTNVIDEKFVASIRDNKVTMPLSEYEKLVENETLAKGLITKSSIFDRFKDKKMIITMLIVFLLMFVFVFWIATKQEAENIYVTIFIAFLLSLFVVNIIVIFVIVFSISYFAKSYVSHRYKRTEKGKEINLQLDGLKNFMKEFTNINNRESKELVLWEDYLIYSVMFNINKSIQNEYTRFFDVN